MNEMIERVAQAICGDDNPANVLEIHRVRALKAIEATEVEKLRGVLFKVRNWLDVQFNEPFKNSELAEHIGLINDALLNEPPGQPISSLPKPLDRGHWGNQ